MTTWKLEADKTALIREILNIDNSELIHQLRTYLHKHASSGKVEDKDFHKTYTRHMIKEFCGAWRDDRTAEEMVDDIYENRSSVKRDATNIFNE